MIRCKICNKEIKPSEKYSNSNYCSVQCEIADYIIEEFCEEFKNDKEVLSTIENYKANLRSSKVAVTTDVCDTADHIYKQYRQDVDYKKSINISTTAC